MGVPSSMQYLTAWSTEGPMTQLSPHPIRAEFALKRLKNGQKLAEKYRGLRLESQERKFIVHLTAN